MSLMSRTSSLSFPLPKTPSLWCVVLWLRCPCPLPAHLAVHSNGRRRVKLRKNLHLSCRRNANKLPAPPPASLLQDSAKTRGLGGRKSGQRSNSQPQALRSAAVPSAGPGCLSDHPAQACCTLPCALTTLPIPLPASSLPAAIPQLGAQVPATSFGQSPEIKAEQQ